MLLFTMCCAASFIWLRLRGTLVFVKRGVSLLPLELFGCFTLYLCALNSKEMAVTLPVIVLIYEIIKYYHRPNRQTLFEWVWRDALPTLIAALITTVYCYAKFGTARRVSTSILKGGMPTCHIIPGPVSEDGECELC